MHIACHCHNPQQLGHELELAHHGAGPSEASDENQTDEQPNDRQQLRSVTSVAPQAIKE